MWNVMKENDRIVIKKDPEGQYNDYEAMKIYKDNRSMYHTFKETKKERIPMGFTPLRNYQTYIMYHKAWYNYIDGQLIKSTIKEVKPNEYFVKSKK